MKQFARFICTKFFFKNKAKNVDYVFKFHIKSKSWDPSTANRLIENSIKKYEAVLRRQMFIFSDLTLKLNPKIKKLRLYLTKNQLFVKITDKNFDFAVFHIDWYLNEIQNHLFNSIVYEHADADDLSQLKYRLKEIIDFARYALSKGMIEYLKQSIMIYSNLYVISKIHKNPWGFKSIISFHSWIISRVSEVGTYYLQSIIAQILFVLQSIKHFIKKLSETEISTENTLFTGDVVFMYINISSDFAIIAVKRAIDCWSDFDDERKNWIKQALKFVLRNNFFHALEFIYKQKNDLAMSTACVSVIVNLFCAIYKLENIVFHDEIQMYVRYIDDIFDILKPNYKLKNIKPLHQLLDLNVKFVVKNKLPFLNVLIEIVEKTNENVFF